MYYVLLVQITVVILTVDMMSTTTRGFLFAAYMIPPTKRFDIFPPDWEMLRRSRCMHACSNFSSNSSNNNSNISSNNTGINV